MLTNKRPLAIVNTGADHGPAGVNNTQNVLDLLLPSLDNVFTVPAPRVPTNTPSTSQV
jgi:hypothetical protein